MGGHGMFDPDHHDLHRTVIRTGNVLPYSDVLAIVTENAEQFTNGHTSAFVIRDHQMPGMTPMQMVDSVREWQRQTGHIATVRYLRSTRGMIVRVRFVRR